MTRRTFYKDGRRHGCIYREMQAYRKCADGTWAKRRIWCAEIEVDGVRLRKRSRNRAKLALWLRDAGAACAEPVPVRIRKKKGETKRTILRRIADAGRPPRG